MELENWPRSTIPDGFYAVALDHFHANDLVYLYRTPSGYYATRADKAGCKFHGFAREDTERGDLLVLMLDSKPPSDFVAENRWCHECGHEWVHRTGDDRDNCPECGELLAE